ncbi:hypothetical protein EJ02DRAFT_457458 [Clathrospora elynae]|uniref:Uncharacterized protein n=1 Tax=Clathrospora elynae TaxID=706981 RepID=A0A6A5SNR9_9PLEO|nr:hypothetical protein EJ02DRAFT_457458 [Clathrospora elynae]
MPPFSSVSGGKLSTATVAEDPTTSTPSPPVPPPAYTENAQAIHSNDGETRDRNQAHTFDTFLPPGQLGHDDQQERVKYPKQLWRWLKRRVGKSKKQ